MNPSKRQVKCLECKEKSDADEAVCKKCFDSIQNNAYDDGFQDGKIDGEKNGYKTGHEEGYDEGYTEAIKKIQDALDKLS